MLVEELRVEVEDEVADDVEAEMARFDHAGVDRTDGDLVGTLSAAWHCPCGEARFVVDERPQRFVACEADVVQVGCFAFVPPGRRGEVDDRDGLASRCGERFQSSRAVRTGEERAHKGALAGGVEPGEAPAVRSRAASATAARYPAGSR